MIRGGTLAIEASDTVTLPVGIQHEDCRYRQVIISEMNGYDEENLSSRKVRNNSSKGLTIVLRRCIQEIPGVLDRKADPNSLIPEAIVRNMVSYDRDYLFFCIRALNGQSEIAARYICPSCGDDVDVTTDLSDINVYEWPDTEALMMDLEFSRGFKVDGVWINKAKWRFLTGRDQEALAKLTGAAMLTSMLHQGIDSFEGIEFIPPESTYKEMSSAERLDAITQLTEDSPGIDLSIQSECGACGEEFDTTLDVSNFFNLESLRKTRKDSPHGRSGRRRLRRV